MCIWSDDSCNLLDNRQTGSGKTYTMFGPPFSMALAVAAQKESGAGAASISGDGILLPEHGFLLRSGLDSLAAVEALKVQGCTAVLHGSMIEMYVTASAE